MSHVNSTAKARAFPAKAFAAKTAIAVLLLAASSASTLPCVAQDAAAKSPAREIFERDSVDRVFPLHYQSSQGEQNEVLTALRNVLDPYAKIFIISTSSMIVVRAPEETQARVAKLLATLDHTRARFRLTYTLTELDGTRKVGVQHFSMVLLAGQREQLKQGSRIAIAAGEAQFTYIDVGMNFDATLTEIQGGAVLKTKVEQTSIAPDSTTATNPNPLIRQTMLEGTTSLATGRPQLLGSTDVPGSTHHYTVEVEMNPAE